ncbi:2'-5' RNA ligase family protein [Actinomadura sp. 1N219]|uniref:2'-5' RNA ligase family protein n=1 Tax=Actinomadura sp. 1N219 TaxID=3375152 RepID=UPI0037C0F943
MSPFPVRMIDRWEHRAEPGPNEGAVYWHILFQDQPQVTKLARYAQERLASFSGLHMTPLKWLHMTTLALGAAESIKPDQRSHLVSEASRRLQMIQPTTIKMDRVLYHPEAIMAGTSSPESLSPIHEAIKAASRTALGRDVHTEPSSWTPHITLCYSTEEQQAAPLIEALGNELPPYEITIRTVSLVLQRGAERLWDWHPIAHVPLGGTNGEARDDSQFPSL